MDSREQFSLFLEQNTPGSTPLIVLGALMAAAFWTLCRLIAKLARAGGSSLPVYKVVTNDVVGILEKAHREVITTRLPATAWVSWRDIQLIPMCTTPRIRNRHSCFPFREWEWQFFLSRKLRPSARYRRQRCPSSTFVVLLSGRASPIPAFGG